MTEEIYYESEGDPNDFEYSLQECWIHWTIIHFHIEKKTDCTITYETIIRDDDYNYHLVTSQENKDSYMDWMYTPKTSKEVSCEGKHKDSWNAFTHKIWDKQYFTIRKYYDWSNYVIKNSPEIYDSWNDLEKCNWNIIDHAPVKIVEEETQTNNYFYYWIFSGIIIFLLIIFVLVRKIYKLKKKS